MLEHINFEVNQTLGEGKMLYTIIVIIPSFAKFAPLYKVIAYDSEYFVI